MLAELEPGWNRIDGGPGTSCSNGSGYAFWFRPGDRSKLTVYFQGGGACWFGESCALDRDPTYDPVVDASDVPAPRGIFDFAHPANPIGDHSVLFVPYCTADIHAGSTTATYSVEENDSLPARSFEIHHRGAANANAALDWVYERIVDPRVVFVTGVSAGSLGSALYAHFVARHYADAPVSQLGDAAGGYRSPAIADLLAQWNASPALDEVGVEETAGAFEALYADGVREPNLSMAQFNYDRDEVQLFFLGMLGVHGTPLADLLDANLTDIERTSTRFVSYVAPGTQHGVLRENAFYDVEVAGVHLHDWTTALIAGSETRSVACAGCR